MTADQAIGVSVVVPVYSGEKYIEKLVDELGRLRSAWASDGAPMQLTEVILVDDAAIDGSPDLIDKLAEANPWIVTIHLMRNFGQHAATIAGILHSSGDWVVTLDEDLQHSPAFITDMLACVARTSSDLVYARPVEAVHESYTRDWGSSLFKWFLVVLSGNENVQNFSSFRLIRGPLARAVASVCGHESYLDIVISWFTEKIEIVRTSLKDERVIKGERSGYSLLKLLSHARRMIVSSRIKLLRIGLAFGVLTIVSSVVGGTLLIINRLLESSEQVVTGWTSLALISIFFGGIITFLLGVIIEYVSTLVLVANGKPLYFAVDRTQDAQLRRYFAN